MKRKEFRNGPDVRDSIRRKVRLRSNEEADITICEKASLQRMVRRRVSPVYMGTWHVYRHAMRLESEDSKDTSSGSTEADGSAVSTVGEQRNSRSGGRGSAGGVGSAAQGGRKVGGVCGRDDRDADTAGTPGVSLSRGDDGGAGGGDGGNAGLSLGADGGGNLVSHEGGGGRRRSTGVGSSGRSGSLGRSSRRRGNDVRVGDTELSGVLVLASSLNDQEETVVGHIGLKSGGGSPGERARVVDLLSNGIEGLNVVAGTTEKDQRDLALGGRVPGDGVGLSSLDLLVETGGVDGVARGRLVVVRVGVGSSQSREGRDSSKNETHFVCFLSNRSNIDAGNCRNKPPGGESVEAVVRQRVTGVG
jgi:hypothetical protein